VIEPLTAEANATARLLKLNLSKRVFERRLLAGARALSTLIRSFPNDSVTP